MFAIEADADVTGNPFIYIHVWGNPWTLLYPQSLSLSTASATGRHLKHTMHMSVKGGQLGVLWPNRGSCNCCSGNVFVGTWQSFKPKSFRTEPAYIFMLVFSTLQSKCRYHHNAILTSSPIYTHTHKQVSSCSICKEWRVCTLIWYMHKCFFSWCWQKVHKYCAYDWYSDI